MAENRKLTESNLAANRLSDLLALLTKQGLSQVQIAAKACIPAQYLSDIKHGRRRMTELVARRLGEEFGVDYQWIMGLSDTMEKPALEPMSSKRGSSSWLPFFPHPIEGEPSQHPEWNGAGVEIAGIAAGKAASAEHPYILQFGRDDMGKRLKKGDLILISQAPNNEAELLVVRYRKKSYLVRANKDGRWTKIGDGKKLSADCPVVGHCVGIIWSALL